VEVYIPEATAKGLAAGHFDHCEWVIIAERRKIAMNRTCFAITIIMDNPDNH
jgi:hypothetical protein